MKSTIIIFIITIIIMVGGGHLFSKKALIKFNEISIHNASLCPQGDSSLDDVFVGKFSQKIEIFRRV